MTVVIKSWRRGSTSYMSGTRAHSSGGSMDSWSCATIDTRNPFKSCSWFGLSGPGYITEGCYNSLIDSDKVQCPSLYQGKVTDSGHWTSYQVGGYTDYIFNPECIVECFTSTCFTIRPDLKCEGVVCDDTCIGADKYSNVCMLEGANAGECAQDQLIEANSPDCPGYDPCLGVVCDPACYGYDLYTTYCEEGTCAKGSLIDVNNRDICEYDPCLGVVCEDKCYGLDKYSMVCVEGECVVDRIVEPNSSDCGYSTPGDTFIDTMMNNKEIIIIGAVVGAIVLKST